MSSLHDSSMSETDSSTIVTNPDFGEMHSSLTDSSMTNSNLNNSSMTDSNLTNSGMTNSNLTTDSNPTDSNPTDYKCEHTRSKFLNTPHFDQLSAFMY